MCICTRILKTPDITLCCNIGSRMVLSRCAGSGYEEIDHKTKPLYVQLRIPSRWPWILLRGYDSAGYLSIPV